MATVPPRTERRRARPGSVERPVNGRLYRGTWLLVGLPLLVAAFSVARPTPRSIVVMAHRDNDGTGLGANDNSSGTAMLVQLARAYGAPPGFSGRTLRPNHTILFVSTDGGAFGALGAAAFAAHSPLRHDVAAVIDLDSVGGPGPIRMQIDGDVPRNPSGTLVETAAARVAAQIGRRPARDSILRQLTDLGFPYSLYEQAPFLAQGIGALTLTTAGDNPPDPLGDVTQRLRVDKLNQVGRSAQDLLGSLDEGLEFAQGTSSYLYLGARLIRGWAIELGLLALAGWLVTRERLIPRREVSVENELAGHTAALLALGALSLLVVATNPYALLFLLPSLHAWLWLPQVQRLGIGPRLGVLALGFAGPALVVGEFAGRYGLGWDAPWYLAELRAVGYVPFIVMPLLVIWLAGAGQLAALSVGRYAPYPDVAELPPRGPVRRVLRSTYLAVHKRRQSRAPDEVQEALEG